ncbi:four helix bundle protein [Bacteroidota bacterium]
MRDFRKLTIWKDSMAIVNLVYRFSDFLPSTEKYGLRSQICRASVSIPSNIAEGCSRTSQIDFKRFLEIALGSSFELETQLLIIQDLNLFGSNNNEFDLIINQINTLQKRINSLINKIKSNS